MPNPTVKRFLAFFINARWIFLSFPILLAMILRVSTLASRIAQYFIALKKFFPTFREWFEPLKYMALVLVIASLLNTHGN